MKKSLSFLLFIGIILSFGLVMSFGEESDSTGNIDPSSVTIQLSEDNPTYTGKPIIPTVTSATANGEDIKSGCTFEYSNNVNAGQQTAKITIKHARFTTDAAVYFNIQKANIENTNAQPLLVSSVDAITYSAIGLTYNGTSVNNNEYTITHECSETSGTVYLTATGPNFKGTKAIPYTIVDGFSDSDVTIANKTFVYDGNPKYYSDYDITVKKGDKVLAKGTDYEVTYNNNTASSAIAQVTITGKGLYTGTVTRTFQIAPKPMANNDSSFKIETVENSSDPNYQPKPKVMFNGRPLTESTDFDYSYETGTTNKVNINGKGNFTGKLSVAYKIGADITSADVKVTFHQNEYAYTGSPVTPTNFEVRYGQFLLRRGTDYKVLYENNVNIGNEAKLKIVGIGNYAGTKEFEFTISSGLIQSSDISLSTYTYIFDNTAKTPSVTVRFAGRLLYQGTDYEVAYSNNTAVGQATVTVTGKGNYKGTATKNFNIAGKSISYLTVRLSAYDFDYDGKAKTPEVIIYDGSTKLVKDTDFKVEYRGNIEVGTATVDIVGIKKYAGNKSETFRIKGKHQDITTEASYYSKYLKSEEFNLSAKATGEASALSYKSSDNRVVVVNSSGTVTIVGTGRATITVTTLGGKGYEQATKLVTVNVKPYKPGFSVYRGSYRGQAKVKITKGKGVTKYQIRYGRMGNYRSYYYAHSNTSYSTQTKTLRGLTPGKVYYIKVRAYKKMSDGTIVWGNWTKTKKVYARY